MVAVETSNLQANPTTPSSAKLKHGTSEDPALALQRDPKNSAEHQWLAMQCSMIKGVRWGLLGQVNTDTGAVALRASWPSNSSDWAGLKTYLLRSGRQNTPIVLKAAGLNEKRPNLIVYMPLPACRSEDTAWVVALEMSYRNKQAYKTLKRLLQWNSEWLKFALSNTPARSSANLATTFAIANQCLDQSTFRGTATALVNQLSRRFACQRVSLGLRKGGEMSIEVLSHSARFNRKASRLGALAAAMDEAADLDAAIIYPPADSREGVMHAHKYLAKTAGTQSIATVPISHNRRIVGAITLERQRGSALHSGQLQQIEQLLALLAPVLWLRHQDERALAAKAGLSAKRKAKQLLGPANIRLKLATLGALSLLLFFGFAQGTWRVSGNAVVEGRVQRTIAAPIDGYIASADVRAGDTIRAGDSLGSMDDSDLRLERLKWSTLRQQMISEAREAMAQRDRAQLSIVNAKISQADAELKLIDEQMSRIRLRAPFDGVVIEGDLSQRLGTPVSRGDTLFKIAPLMDYRIVLNVNEHDIAPIENGQFGRLVLSSMPSRGLIIRVDKVTPVSTAANGENTFRVEASLLEQDVNLQPGMEGVGKISVGEANLFWIWTRELGNWLRLKTWTWWR